MPADFSQHRHKNSINNRRRTQYAQNKGTKSKAECQGCALHTIGVTGGLLRSLPSSNGGKPKTEICAKAVTSPDSSTMSVYLILLLLSTKYLWFTGVSRNCSLSASRRRFCLLCCPQPQFPVPIHQQLISSLLLASSTNIVSLPLSKFQLLLCVLHPSLPVHRDPIKPSIVIDLPPAPLGSTVPIHLINLHVSNLQSSA